MSVHSYNSSLFLLILLIARQINFLDYISKVYFIRNQLKINIMTALILEQIIIIFKNNTIGTFIMYIQSPNQYGGKEYHKH